MAYIYVITKISTKDPEANPSHVASSRKRVSMAVAIAYYYREAFTGKGAKIPQKSFRYENCHFCRRKGYCREHRQTIQERGYQCHKIQEISQTSFAAKNPISFEKQWRNL